MMAVVRIAAGDLFWLVMKILPSVLSCTCDARFVGERRCSWMLPTALLCFNCSKEPSCRAAYQSVACIRIRRGHNTIAQALAPLNVRQDRSSKPPSSRNGTGFRNRPPCTCKPTAAFGQLQTPALRERTSGGGQQRTGSKCLLVGLSGPRCEMNDCPLFAFARAKADIPLTAKSCHSTGRSERLLSTQSGHL